MPLSAKMVNGKARVIEKGSGNIALNDSGTPIDGGGHSSIGEAKKQSTAINISTMKKNNKG